MARKSRVDLEAELLGILKERTGPEQAEATLRQYWSRVREVARRARALEQVVHERFGVKLQKEFHFDEPAG